MEDNEEIVPREVNIATIVRLVREHHVAGDARSELEDMPEEA